jgi:hypothetical protein
MKRLLIGLHNETYKKQVVGLAKDLEYQVVSVTRPEEML